MFKTKWLWRSFGGLILLTLVLVSVFVIRKNLAWNWTISKETSYLTKPLTSDGTGIDYIRALNEIYAPPGFDTEKNGFRLVAQNIANPELPDIGKQESNIDGMTFWEALCKELRMDPDRKPTLTIPDLKKKTFDIYTSEHDIFYGHIKEENTENAVPQWREHFTRYFEMSTRPDEYEVFRLLKNDPQTFAKSNVISDILHDNAELMRIFAEAVRKEVYFVPIIGPEKSDLYDTLLPYAIIDRSLAQLIEWKCTMNLAEGNVEEAIEDVFTLSLSARHLSNTSMEVCYLVAYSIEAYAHDALLRVLRYGNLTREQLVNLKHRYDKLPRFCDVAHTFKTERFIALSIIQGMKWNLNSNFFSDFDDFRIEKLFTFSCNKLGKIFNAHYDRLDAAFAISNPTDRLKALQDFEYESDLFFHKKQIPLTTDAAAQIILALVHPATLAYETVYCQWIMVDDMSRLAIALELYKQDHEQMYPERLDELIPDYIAGIPNDPLDKNYAPYHYVRESSESYLLYSFGQTRKDELGRCERDEPPGNNYRIRMPEETAEEALENDLDYLIQ